MADDVDVDTAAPADILAALIGDPDLIAAELALAQDAAEYARSIAPEETGAYRESIVVEQSGDAVYVAFNDPAAHIVEYGNATTPEYAIRAKTEEQFNK